jgi:exopolysaccharide production protein ExoZ
MSKIHHIQALRGIAASLVVLDHALGPIVKRGILPEYFDAVRYNLGSMGVQTFFVISGFIMFHTSYNDFGGLRSSLLFAEKRLIRIVPIYWAATLLAVFLSRFGENTYTTINLLESLAFIPYVDPNGHLMQPVLGPGWTLNYEVFFYTLFAIALLAPRRVGLPGLFLVFIGIVAGGAGLKPLSDTSAPSTMLIFWSQPLILLFATGVGIGVIEKHFRGRITHPFQVACILVASQVFICIAFKIPQDLPFPIAILFWIPGVLAVTACVFAVQASEGRFEIIVERVGDASYSTYLFHIFILAALNRIIPLSSTFLSVCYVLIALVGSNLVGLLIYSTIERPMTSFLRDRRGLKALVSAGGGV